MQDIETENYASIDDFKYEGGGGNINPLYSERKETKEDKYSSPYVPFT